MKTSWFTYGIFAGALLFLCGCLGILLGRRATTDPAEPDSGLFILDETGDE